MATKKDTNENPWADDQLGDFSDDNGEHKKSKQPQPDDPQDRQHKGKEGKRLTEKLGDGLHRTKEGASRSMKKVFDGASVGLFWMKDKFRKPAGAKAPPTPPPPPNSSPSL